MLAVPWDLQLWLCHSRSARSFEWIIILWSLLTLKSSKSASVFGKIVPFSHGTWVRAIVCAKHKAVFVFVLMCPGCAVGDIDRCEVVKIPAMFSCPSDFGLGCTIFGIVDPSEFNGVLFVFSCSPLNVLLFPMIFFSWIFAVFYTSWVIDPHEAMGNNHNFKTEFLFAVSVLATAECTYHRSSGSILQVREPSTRDIQPSWLFSQLI